MDSENDYELNDILDICLSKAKNIGMRGDLIDACTAIKIFRDHINYELIDKKKYKGEFDYDKFDEQEFFDINIEKQGDDHHAELLKLFETEDFLNDSKLNKESEISESSFTQSVITKSDIGQK